MSTLAFIAMHLRALARDQRGQAMVEYSTVTFAILGIMSATAFALPVLNGQSLAQALYSGLQIYVNSMFYSLSLSIP